MIASSVNIHKIMNRTSIFIILWTFISLHLYSQEAVESKKSIGFHFMPLTLIDYTPRIRVGVEKRTNSNIGYCLELGYGNYWLNKNRLIFDGMIWNKDYRFFEVRPELKYYFDRHVTYYHCYTAVELFYTHMTDQMSNDYYHNDNTEKIILFDQADYSKDKLGLHIKGGFNIIVFNKLDFDFYVGLGIAWRKIHYQNVINPVNGVHGLYEWIVPFYKFEGKTTMLHTTLGCKIGIVFKK